MHCDNATATVYVPPQPSRPARNLPVRWLPDRLAAAGLADAAAEVRVAAAFRPLDDRLRVRLPTNCRALLVRRCMLCTNRACSARLAAGLAGYPALNEGGVVMFSMHSPLVDGIYAPLPNPTACSPGAHGPSGLPPGPDNYRWVEEVRGTGPVK